MKELYEINPFRIIVGVFILLILSFFVGLILPGYIAYKDGVFYDKDIKNKLPLYAKRSVANYDKEMFVLIKTRDSLEKQLAKFSYKNYKEVNSLLVARNLISNEIRRSKADLSFRGFYNFKGLIILWPLIYFFHSCLLVFATPKPKKVNKKKVFMIGALLWPIYRWTTWYRNIFPNDTNRKIFSANNYDISPINFWVQEFMALITLALVTLTIYCWIEYFEDRRSEIEKENAHPLTELTDTYIQNRLSFTFIQWQVASLLLSLGFFGYTKYFWDVVFIAGDQRFIFHAIIMHIIWALTWIVISLPLLITQYDWFKIKQSVILSSLMSDSDKIDKNILLTKEIEPIGFWNIGISGAVSILSFFYPILKNLF